MGLLLSVYSKQLMYRLKKKNTLLGIILFMLISPNIFSQGKYFGDDKFIHFGFSLGTNLMDFGITPSLQDIEGVVYQADVSKLLPGFSVGIIGDMKLNRYLNLRFTPTLHFGDRQLSYSAVNNSGFKDSLVVSSAPICLPLYIKYSSERYGNLRPYLICGGGIYFDFGTDKDKPVYLKPFDVFAEFGVGCDIYFSFFKLAPELKFSIGGNNLFIPLDERTNEGTLKDDDRKFSLALSKLTARMLTLTFNIE